MDRIQAITTPEQMRARAVSSSVHNSALTKSDIPGRFTPIIASPSSGIVDPLSFYRQIDDGQLKELLAADLETPNSNDDPVEVRALHAKHPSSLLDVPEQQMPIARRSRTSKRFVGLFDDPIVLTREEMFVEEFSFTLR